MKPTPRPARWSSCGAALLLVACSRSSRHPPGKRGDGPALAARSVAEADRENALPEHLDRLALQTTIQQAADGAGAIGGLSFAEDGPAVGAFRKVGFSADAMGSYPQLVDMFDRLAGGQLGVESLTIEDTNPGGDSRLYQARYRLFALERAPGAPDATPVPSHPVVAAHYRAEVRAVLGAALRDPFWLLGPGHPLGDGPPPSACDAVDASAEPRAALHMGVMPSGMLRELANLLTPGHLPTMSPETAAHPDPGANPSWDSRRLELERLVEEGCTVTLSGWATSADDPIQLQRRMGDSVFFANVVQTELRRAEDGRGVRFQLRARASY